MNSQPPEKQIHNPAVIAVHSIFSTIQGEGPFTGHRAVFVRLAGCNLACPMCDTDYTSKREYMSPEIIVQEVIKLFGEAMGNPFQGDNHLVVITGGEPFRQYLGRLMEALLEAGMDVQIETNGTLYQDLPYGQFVVVCSPKTGKLNQDLLPHIDALKYVVCAGQVSTDDGLPLSALEHPCSPVLARPPAGYEGLIYIQPADEKDEVKNKANQDAALQSALKYGYLLQLQTHKLLGVE